MSGSTGGGAPARETPFELVFGGEEYDAEVFPAIREEAGARQVDAGEVERFVQLTSVGSLLRALLPEDAAGSTIAELGHLVYQAYHFWLNGRHLVVLEDALARRLLRTPPVVGAWSLEAPHPAGYLQLPRNLVWARVAEGAAAEAVDGLFWTMTGGSAPARLELLLVLGLRPGRPGFTVVEVGAPLPEAGGHWADVAARADGTPDFATTLPGGELSGLHSLASPLEVLKLASLSFRHAAVHPEALARVAPAREAEAATSPGTPASALAYELLRDDPSGG